MLQFGFELEGFYIADGVVSLPPKGWPTDGFPGLCEVRTSGGQNLEIAYFELLRSFMNHQFDTTIPEHTFTAIQRQNIRARHNEKTAVSIENIYGKAPRHLGNRTLASFQINISRVERHEYYDDKGVRHPATYGLFDYVPIIRALDKEFAAEIAAAHRQPGFYAIKDGSRVEYRSLPNTVFVDMTESINRLLTRIRRCTIEL